MPYVASDSPALQNAAVDQKICCGVLQPLRRKRGRSVGPRKPRGLTQGYSHQGDMKEARLPQPLPETAGSSLTTIACVLGDITQLNVSPPSLSHHFTRKHSYPVVLWASLWVSGAAASRNALLVCVMISQTGSFMAVGYCGGLQGEVQVSAGLVCAEATVLGSVCL